jgi:hypothetical protein
VELERLVPKMTKLYLHRTLESVLKDVRRPDEDVARDLILKNRDALADRGRIRAKLDFLQLPYDMRVLSELCLEVLVDEQDYAMGEEELLKAVEHSEQATVEEAKREESLAFGDQNALSIFRDVLTAAWKKDGDLNPHEAYVMQTLADRLGIAPHEHRLIEAQLGRFPTSDARPHSPRLVDEALKELQNRGLVVRYREGAKTAYAIPEEVAVPLRAELGIELRGSAFRLLLQTLSNTMLQRILKRNGLSPYGSKDEMVERILSARLRPSAVLDVVSNEELYGLLKKLPNATVGGNKPQRIENLIRYYDVLVTRRTEHEVDPRAAAYAYLSELARRDYAQLRGNQLIEKDLDVEHLFERATHYLFEIKLGHKAVRMPGSEHADGKLPLPRGEVILWDNKSCEGPYPMTDAALDQFKRYIRAERDRVTLFMVIAPAFGPEAGSKAERLKLESGEDTDVALITADELKWLAENWTQYRKRDDQPFNLAVLDYTGRLTVEQMRSRLKWAL